MTTQCPTCASRAPHMHPAVQHEGEVEICPDGFHLEPTPQNRREYILAVRRKRAWITRRLKYGPNGAFPDGETP